MYGLIGKSLTHSFSKLIHEKLQPIQYDLIELNQIDRFFTQKAFKGVNVTIPFKNQVIKYVDTLSKEATKTQSVNTIVNKKGILYGYNTDYFALEYLLKHNQINIENKVIGILGNGSSSRTISVLCNDMKAKEVLIFARNPRDNEHKFTDKHELKKVNILFHATPNGMFPNNNDEPLVDLDLMHHLEAVVDLVYNPLRTNIILDAEKRKIKAVNGLMMLVHQAVLANEIFFGNTHPADTTLKLYKDIYLQQVNYVLIGMPMSGKTHYAKAISEKYNKKFTDIDQIIETQQRMKIDEIFRNHGETGFRNMERTVISEVSKDHNLAISPGAGIILNEKNILNLKQNGIILFLDVPLKMLESMNPKNRPLLKTREQLKTIYDDRIDRYHDYSDIAVKKSNLRSVEVLHNIEVKINEYFDSKWT